MCVGCALSRACRLSAPTCVAPAPSSLAPPLELLPQLALRRRPREVPRRDLEGMETVTSLVPSLSSGCAPVVDTS